MQKGKSAFTLIELMIVIVLIGIIFLMFGNMNLNYMWDKQKAEQFANKIISEIETVRNNALVGRAIKVWNEYKIPNHWSIIIHKSYPHPANTAITVNPKNSITTYYYLKPNIAPEDRIEYNEVTFNPSELKIEAFFPDCDSTKIINDLRIIFKDNSTQIETWKCFTNFITIKSKKGIWYRINIDAVTGLVTKEYLWN